jgi:ribonuclease BN (tRNA processing enzyme)
MPEGMRLAVLGSGSCELRQARSSPAYLLQAGDSAVMLDLGQGAWRRLLDREWSPLCYRVFFSAIITWTI